MLHANHRHHRRPGHLSRPQQPQPHSSSADRVAARPASPALRRMARRRAERGIILVFVVVLLSLLAIMGTAYLATSRIDRQTLTANPVAPGEVTPMLRDPAMLDRLLAGMKLKTGQQLIDDLFNLQPGVLLTLQDGNNLTLRQRQILQGTFRQVGDSSRSAAYGGPAAPFRFYENYDAPGPADPFLASLLPVNLEIFGDEASPNSTDMTLRPSMPLPGQPRYRWPWISAPFLGEPRTAANGAPGDAGSVAFGADLARQILPGIDVEPFFADPRTLTATTTGYTRKWATTGANLTDAPTPARADALIRSVEMLREDARTEAGSNTRVYPALLPIFAPAGSAPFLSGDADGDGIADCGLMPVVLNPKATGVARYLDGPNNVVYLVGYRIVDNSAKVNMTTALSVQGDFSGEFFSVKTSNNAQAFASNYGNVTTQGSDGELRNVLALEANPGFGFANGPNLGFFGTNVGLVELFREQMRPFSGASTTNMQVPAVRGLQDFLDARFPLIARTPAGGNDLAASGLVAPDGTAELPAAYALRAMVNPRDPNTNTAGLLWPRLFLGERFNAPANTASNLGYQFASFGDLHEHLLTQRSSAPRSAYWKDTNTTPTTLTDGGFRWLPTSDAVSLARLDGALRDDRITPAIGEEGASVFLQMAAPNYTAGGQPTWRYFPSTFDGVYLWYHWTQDFEIFDYNTPIIGILDGVFPLAANVPPPTVSPSPVPPPRVFNFIAGGDLANAQLPKSIRTLLTTYSGVTANAPRRFSHNLLDLYTGLPRYMPLYDANNVGFPVFPATRVSAATGTKEQLWRAYWSVMTHNVYRDPTNPLNLVGPLVNGAIADSEVDRPATGTEPYDAFKPSDRHPSVNTGTAVTDYAEADYRLDERQMALIRSAVAACNTIDLRDADNDITAMTVDLGFDTHAERAWNDDAQATRQPMFARVFGTERQLVISSVVIDEPVPPAGGGAPPVDAPQRQMWIEIFNPSDEPIDLRGYRLGVVQRSDPAGRDVTLRTGSVTVAPEIDEMVLLCSQAANTTDDTRRILQPGGFLIVYCGDDQPDESGLLGVTVTPENTDPSNVGERQILYRFNNDTLNNPTDVLSDAIRPNYVTVADRELVLVRTRRSDGVITEEDDQALETDPSPLALKRPAISEGDLDDANTLLTLVPIDAVDLRSLTYPKLVEAGNQTGQRYIYQRQVNNFGFREETQNETAWKAFYSGRGYEMQPASGTLIEPTVPPTIVDPADPTATATLRYDWAWREYPFRENAPSVVPEDRAGEVVLGDATLRLIATGDDVTAGPATPAQPFLAPTIPIQNFTPSTNAYIGATPTALPIDHSPNAFPYGSPFARDGDVLAVPFIGSYTIYRYPAHPSGLWQPGSAPEAVYEYVPVTMDAVAVAPRMGVSGAGAENNPSIGRFDARVDPAAIVTATNAWADDLFDFVTARHAPGNQNFPDVPLNVVNDFNNPMAALTDQDGPVRGYSSTGLAGNRNTAYSAIAGNATPPAFPQGGDPAVYRTPWVSWNTATNGNRSSVARNGAPVNPNPALPAQIESIMTEQALIPGVLNLNTAPPVNQRMLPFMVDPGTGTSTTPPGVAGIPPVDEQRRRAVWADKTMRQQRATQNAVVGFPSLFEFSDAAALNAEANTPSSTSELMYSGDLQPFYRPTSNLDFTAQTRDLTRISNLASTRSDVFTVYVTVQAWTWAGDNQGTDTRLVGERRGAYIMDRSRIRVNFDNVTDSANPTFGGYTTSDLVIIPVVEE